MVHKESSWLVSSIFQQPQQESGVFPYFLLSRLHRVSHFSSWLQDGCHRSSDCIYAQPGLLQIPRAVRAGVPAAAPSPGQPSPTLNLVLPALTSSVWEARLPPLFLRALHFPFHAHLPWPPLTLPNSKIPGGRSTKTYEGWQTARGTEVQDKWTWLWSVWGAQSVHAILPAPPGKQTADLENRDISLSEGKHQTAPIQ